MYLFNSLIVPSARWTCLITVAVTALYYVFKQNFYLSVKCSLGRRRNQMSRRSSSAYRTMVDKSFHSILRLEWRAKLLNRLLFTLYTINMAKYTLMILLDIEALADYRKLDCFLVGRLALMGRSSGTAKYIALTVTVFLFTYRLLLVISRPEFNFDCIQFILNGADVAMENEIKSLDLKGAGSPAGNATSTSIVDGFRGRVQVLGARRRSRYEVATNGRHRKTVDYDTCYFTPNYFDMSGDLFHNNLRPNRTVHSWRELNLYTFALVAYFVLYFTVLVPLLYRAVAPTVLTRTGFWLNYGNCHSWLREQRRLHNADYATVCSAEQLNRTRTINVRSLPFLLPLDDLFEPTWYGLLRVLMDVIENHFLYADFFGTFAVHSTVVFQVVFDIYINYKSIRRRMIEIIHFQMAARANSELAAGQRSAEPSSAVGLRSLVLERLSIQTRNQSHLAQQLEATITTLERVLHLLTGLPIELTSVEITGSTCELEIVRTQNILVDHFLMIGKYNRYMEFHVEACLILWLAYTTILCVWTSIAGSQAVAAEFYAAFLVSLVLIIFMLGGPASLHWCNHQLYKTIATTMALDSFVETRARWINILKYYYQTPLYCFSLFRSSSLSWLFCLKLYSWVVTALLVVGNYLIFYKMDTLGLS